MGKESWTPVIAKVIIKKLRRDGTRKLTKAYTILFFDEDGNIFDRYEDTDLRELIETYKYFREPGWPRVSFDAIEFKDHDEEDAIIRVYYTLTLEEIFYASPALGQS